MQMHLYLFTRTINVLFFFADVTIFSMIAIGLSGSQNIGYPVVADNLRPPPDRVFIGLVWLIRGFSHCLSFSNILIILREDFVHNRPFWFSEAEFLRVTKISRMHGRFFRFFGVAGTVGMFPGQLRVFSLCRCLDTCNNVEIKTILFDQ